jgi:tricorn protease
MKKNIAIVLTVFILMIVGSAGLEAAQLIGARFPALSPDGSKIAFSYMGDIWSVPSSGGRAWKLTDHTAYDGWPVWSPDGKNIVFTSDRFGNNDVFVMSADGGDPVRLTFHSGNDMATDVTPDGEWVIFESNRSSSSSLFKIPVKGGNAYPVLDSYWIWPHFARMHPKGDAVLFALGMEHSSWWRRGYRGSNTSSLWKKSFDSKPAVRLYGDESNCFWPHWDPAGEGVYFVSDRKDGVKNIWKLDAAGTEPVPVTRFKKMDITWMSLADDVPVAVYEREFGIWRTDLLSGKSESLSITAPAEMKDNRIFYVENDPVSEYRLSPDGKKIAAVVRGEIFILSTDGGYTRNVTRTPWRERQPVWDMDSLTIYYISDENANPDLYKVSALGEEKPERLTRSEEDELKPEVSPDGKWLAYYRGKRQLRLLDLESKKDTLLLEDDLYGLRATPPAWSPDSRYIALEVSRNANTDIFAIDILSKEKQLLTNTAYDEGGPFWSPDGRSLLFTSNRFGHSFPEFSGKWDLYQLHLEPQKPEFKEDDFEKLFRAEEKVADKNDTKKKDVPHVTLTLTDIDRQTQPVSDTLGDDSEFILSPKDGTTIYFVSTIDGSSHLWTTSLDKKKRGKYEPFVPAVSSPRQLQTDSAGKYLYYLSRGGIGRIDLGSNRSSPISFSTRIEVDKTADYEQMLGELYYTLRYYYYDDKFHDVDWTALYEQHRPVLQQVREDADFYDYANMLIGYLNSSHTGIRGPFSERTVKPSAHIGADWSISEGKFYLNHILAEGPLDAHRGSISPGDRLAAVNDTPLSADSSIWKLLNGHLSKRLKLTFIRKSDTKQVDLLIEPISSGAENRLRLVEWVSANRDRVREKTGDQAAYLYMSAMGQSNLTRFLKELERDAFPRKGVILDLRYNFGGNVHDRVLEALMKPVYAKWRVRGMSETPQSTFGMANKPVVLLINEVTLSDGEMTANGFKALKRGPIVGNTTYGWLIFTTSTRLMNGGSFRLPFWGCYTLDGQDLETSGGVKPDIVVINDLNHDLLGQDPQLDKAIEILLNLIK